MTPSATVGLVCGAVLIVHLLWRRRRLGRERRVAAQARELAAFGELVPDTLHPAIDADRCIGSGACVEACPEHDVIGLVGGRAQLLNGLACVGHSACVQACPVEAISLVFGSARRGVELPNLDPDFQTNRPGIYVIGELGGMGLIRNAVRQGAQAAAHVALSSRRGGQEVLDAVVVGAGPAGISATLGLMKAGLSVELLEADEFGGSLRHYPRAKVVMSGRLELPLYGVVSRKTMTKEELVDLWEGIRVKSGLPVTTGVRVQGIDPGAGATWTVRTSSGTRRAASVILALGRRGTPRRLGIPGEGLGKVVYRVLEPEAFRGQRVLVVGGGDAALESALALADSGACASLALSYRRAELLRVRPQNRSRYEAAVRAGRIRALLPTELTEIQPDRVLLKGPEGPQVLRNDSVVVQIGGTAPAEVLGSFGIELVTKFGEA